MNAFLRAAERWIVAALLLLCLALGLAATQYRQQAMAANADLATLQQQLRQQHLQAQAQLADLTRQRDARQAALNALHAHQEQTDAETAQHIARLESELATRPVRVRIATRPANCGGGGAGTAGAAAATADAGAADAAQTHGLLPAANARRLGAVIAEAETINAAYASCRARLLQQQGQM